MKHTKFKKVMFDNKKRVFHLEFIWWPQQCGYEPGDVILTIGSGQASTNS